MRRLFNAEPMKIAACAVGIGSISFLLRQELECD
jgi:hypothetical protein